MTAAAEDKVATRFHCPMNLGMEKNVTTRYRLTIASQDARKWSIAVGFSTRTR
jgi:hypothetical protein